ncbi:hypothetical protein K9N68_34980 (plasmid) [Kovacikia minuta CCNUW1]|uniref:hypothetical protein n=1 Tax=Kovacikia minuta TaxID=2931930 RepID=UPI001CCFA30A|nr:hypothetical protein [Kovacikia minuta]UBF30405.1 hypothetical protein K9N68_34980 [Kovacikia minuta CCNUW1]
MQGTQLELDLQQALADPGAADLNQLWQVLEQVLQPLPRHQQLRVAGEAIAQIAELICIRAQQILDGMDQNNLVLESEPLLEPWLCRELLEPFIRQSISFNLDQMVVPPTPRQRGKSIQSLVGECNKEALLQFLDDEQSKQQALAFAHSEAVEDWVVRLQEFFIHNQEPISFMRLVRSTELNWVEVWMGLLLGGFWLEQQGEFYDPSTLMAQG